MSSANPHERDGRPTRQEWVRANFTQIFGVSAESLRAQGIDPRRYARDHRDKIRRFARMQRRQGIRGGGPSDSGGPADNGPTGGDPAFREYGRAGRYGRGVRGGTAWIGVLVALFALRFLIVDSFVGPHAAVLWILEIGGIMLVARVLLFSWLRNRRARRRQSGGPRDGHSDP